MIHRSKGMIKAILDDQKALQMTQRKFGKGVHSFYGRVRIVLLEGEAELAFYNMKIGEEYKIFAPTHNLPSQIVNNEEIKVELRVIDDNCLSKYETMYYKTPTKNSFKEIIAGCYYSSSFPKINLPQNVVTSIEEQISQKINSKLFIAGKKGRGKSTTSRYITNYLLNKFSKVFYLDLDPGQPEHCVPTSLSLSAIESPITTPAEMPSAAETIIMPYGYTNLDNTEHFMNCILTLKRLIPKDAPVIINSFGYIDGDGKAYHDDILKLLSIDVGVILVSANDKIEGNFKKFIRYEVNKLPSESSIKPTNHRNLRFLTYFTRGLPVISSQRPISIPLRRIRFCFSNSKIPPRMALEAAVGSLAFLINDPTPFPENKTLVSIINHIPAAPALCLCVVVSADIEEGVISVVAPPNSRVEEANTVFVVLKQIPMEMLTDNETSPPNYVSVLSYKGNCIPPPEVVQRIRDERARKREAEKEEERKKDEEERERKRREAERELKMQEKMAGKMLRRQQRKEEEEKITAEIPPDTLSIEFPTAAIESAQRETGTDYSYPPGFEDRKEEANYPPGFEQIQAEDDPENRKGSKEEANNNYPPGFEREKISFPPGFEQNQTKGKEISFPPGFEDRKEATNYPPGFEQRESGSAETEAKEPKREILEGNNKEAKLLIEPKRNLRPIIDHSSEEEENDRLEEAKKDERKSTEEVPIRHAVGFLGPPVGSSNAKKNSDTPKSKKKRNRKKNSLQK